MPVTLTAWQPTHFVIEEIPVILEDVLVNLDILDML